MAVVRTLIGNVKGVKGDTGAQGEQGNAGEITIGSVTTGSYGTPAAVVNSGTPTNAVLDFTIPQGAPGATVTDASPLTASTITTATADYPTYTAGETIAVILGKIAKFFSDIRANGLFKSNLVNGFTQTTPGVNALDAAAGKSLNDSLATKAEASSLSALQTSFDNYKTVNTGSQTVTNTYGTVECYWRKVGNTAFMTVIFTPSQNLNTSSGALDISNAPAPLSEVLGATYDSTNASNNVGTVQFGTGKIMYFNGPRTSGHSYHGSITYLCNS